MGMAHSFTPRGPKSSQHEGYDTNQWKYQNNWIEGAWHIMIAWRILLLHTLEVTHQTIRTAQSRQPFHLPIVCFPLHSYTSDFFGFSEPGDTKRVGFRLNHAICAEHSHTCDSGHGWWWKKPTTSHPICSNALLFWTAFFVALAIATLEKCVTSTLVFTHKVSTTHVPQNVDMNSRDSGFPLRQGSWLQNPDSTCSRQGL